MKKLAPLFLGCLLLTACRVDLPPIEACFITNDTAGGEPAEMTELSPVQLKPLAAWFAARHDDWKFEVTDHYPSGLVLQMKHPGGRKTHANLRGDVLWVRNHCRVLTSAERSELMTIIAVQHQLPAFGRK
ncbi:MAG: hypothetical protein PSV13_07950 [Lacunisphaera sp.]|nr:hypothetical protein [Lacunisphaera sp.]